MQKEIFEKIISLYKEMLLRPLQKGDTLHNYITIHVEEETKKK